MRALEVLMPMGMASDVRRLQRLLMAGTILHISLGSGVDVVGMRMHTPVMPLTGMNTVA